MAKVLAIARPGEIALRSVTRGKTFSTFKKTLEIMSSGRICPSKTDE